MPPPIDQWTLDASDWQAFVARQQAHASQPDARRARYWPRDDAPEADRRVVVEADLVRVGGALYELAEACAPDVVEHEGWLEFLDDASRPGGGMFAVPLPRDGAARGARIATHFRDRIAHYQVLAAQAAAERAAPTLSNKMLDVVEKHFIVLLLLFFFVLLPGVAVLAAFL